MHRMFCASFAAIVALGLMSSSARGEDVLLLQPRYPVEDKLEVPTDLQYLDTPLGDVLIDLELRHKLDMELDERALTADGLSSETPISLSLKGAPLVKALDEILEPHGLTWILCDGLVVITTKTAAETKEMIRVYSLAALREAAGEIDVENLQETIRYQTGFESWLDGQDVETAEVNVVSNTLVVRHIWRIHRQVALVLQELVESANHPETAVLPAPTEREAQIEKALSTKTEVQYLDTPLSDVAQDLELRHKTFIELNLTKPQLAEGIMVTLSLKDVPLSVALSRITERHYLTWTVDDASIIIMEPVHEYLHMVRKRYRVDDLVGDDPKAAVALAELFRKAFWRGEALQAYTAYPPAKTLIVTQTGRAHRDVADLLAQLRAAKKP